MRCHDPAFTMSSKCGYSAWADKDLICVCYILSKSGRGIYRHSEEVFFLQVQNLPMLNTAAEPEIQTFIPAEP